ncbi:IclR family transcriptional regulator [Roseomonas populi]|uniref:IclR family transcriptional regulator n=1 Tax=Roseomonas populi TaxID=3121582 RepID=A0ABT1X6X2_9PROT|nr:IclR family transcriptional regulator [Roseomonas pecuniae]MCR0983858.1 IclR family transcriptional regulator [Roseomonas pecuniae]
MESSGSSGHQGIERSLALLRAVAAEGRGGARLGDVAAQTGLSRSTAHRLLTHLVAAGLLEQDPDAPHYHLGFEIYALGRRAAERHGVPELARASLVRLEERSEDTVYLSIRSGDDALCTARQEGRYPIKTLTLSVGDRRPLGVGAGSLAVLAALPDEEVERVIAANAGRLRAFPGFSAATLRALVERTRAEGCATNPGLVLPGMMAVGVPIRTHGERVAGALSIAAIEGRMQPERRAQLVTWLQEEAAAIARRLDGP